jgi:hypothetical protein
MAKWLVPILLALSIHGQSRALELSRIDSVTVDSVWNADTADQYGIAKVRRRATLSFIPVASDSVTCVVDMSLDGGSTWIPSRGLFERVDGLGATRAAPNEKTSIVLRISGGDKSNVVFRVSGSSDTTKLTSLRITGPHEGWSEADRSYTYYWDDVSLARLINGYALAFVEHGMLDGFSNRLVKQETLEATLFVMDCGVEARALALYNTQRSPGDTLMLAFGDSVASARPNLAGISVVARFRRFYVEMSLVGYSLRDSAVQDANGLLRYFQQRVGLAP